MKTLFKMPHLALHRQPAGKTHIAKHHFGVDGLLVQHAFALFLGSTIILLLAFLLFFYTYFYRIISGDAAATSETIHALPKTINLGSYQRSIETHAAKVDMGKDFAQGKKTIDNPFIRE